MLKDELNKLVVNLQFECLLDLKYLSNTEKEDLLLDLDNEEHENLHDVKIHGQIQYQT